MRHVSTKAILAIAGFGALLGGCATTVEMGPGYYHYDTRAARSDTPVVVYQEPTVVYREPIAYREPMVVYRDSTVLYTAPPLFRRSAPFQDHGS